MAKGRGNGRSWLEALADRLVAPQRELGRDIRLALIRTLYAGSWRWLGASAVTVLLSAAVAWRHPYAPFLLWPVLECGLAMLRRTMFRRGRSLLARGTAPPAALVAGPALLSGASLGYGMSICLASGDWIAATLACFAGAALVAAYCLHFLAVPRLAAATSLIALLPCAVAAGLSRDPLLLMLAMLAPLAAIGAGAAAFRLHRLLVRTIEADHDDERRACHDPLTGLLNRAGLARAAAERIRAGAPFELHHIDLDGFRQVNDGLGHDIGDALLRGVGDRLGALCGSRDTIARITGDQFVILTARDGAADARAFGDAIVRAIGERPFVLGSEEASVAACVGIALFPAHGQDLSTLMGEAAAALHEVKLGEGGRCAVARFSAARQSARKAPFARRALPEPILDRTAA